MEIIQSIDTGIGEVKRTSNDEITIEDKSIAKVNFLAKVDYNNIAVKRTKPLKPTKISDIKQIDFVNPTAIELSEHNYLGKYNILFADGSTSTHLFFKSKILIGKNLAPVKPTTLIKMLDDFAKKLK